MSTLLRVEGAVRSPRELAFDELAALPGQLADVGALAAKRRGGAVRARAVVEAAGAEPGAEEIVLVSTDGFEQEAPIAALDEAWIVYRLGDGPLPDEDGGPVRFLVPDLDECCVADVDRCTNVKRLATIRLR